MTRKMGIKQRKERQPSQSEEEESANKSPLDALPDELLLHILAQVEDGLTLLDAVPLVCRRWLALSRDPRAWAGVRLHLRCWRKTDMEGSPIVVLQDEGRLLTRAPALGWLSLDWHYYNTPKQELPAVRLDCSLRRCTGRVRALHLVPRWKEMPGRACPIILSLLRRARDHLRVATLSMSKEAAGRRSLLGAIAKLHRLEDLHLSLDDSFKTYTGLLAAGLPSLRRLNVSHSRSNSWSMPPAGSDLVCDLLDGSSATLQHVSLPIPAFLASARQKLSQCAQLRSLTADKWCVGILASLPLLREFTLRPACDYVNDYLKRPPSGALPDLRRLHVNLDTPLCEDLLVKLAQAAPNTTCLTINYKVPFRGQKGQVPDGIGEMLDSMPRLRDLRLPTCRADVVPRLMALEALRSVKVVVRCSADEMSDLHALLKDFKVLRPDLKASIKVELDGPQEYTW